MQIIDETLGRPLLWLFQLFTPRAQCLGGDRKPDHPPHRVICTKFVGLGSVVLGLPLFKALQDAGVEVAFWSFSSQAEFVRSTGYAKHIWVFKPTLLSFIPSLLKTIFQARAFRADAFIDLEPTANLTALLARFSGAKTRVGFLTGKPSRESLFTHLVALTGRRHMTENCLWMAHAIGLPIDITKADLPPIPGSLLKTELPSKLASLSAKPILININTSDLARRLRMWPDSSWIQFCNELLTHDPQIEILFPGANSERGFVDKIISGIKEKNRVRNIAGMTTLPELLALLQNCKLAISVDSGIMHLAAWVGTPLLGIFGPDTPILYAPKSKTALSLWKALPCSPCCTIVTEKHTLCRDNQCMKQILPREVLAAVKDLLNPVKSPDHCHHQWQLEHPSFLKTQDLPL